MAFCTYCGTKLEDGQVCNCRATATPVTNPYAAPNESAQQTYAPVNEQPAQNQQSTGSTAQNDNKVNGNVFAPIIDLVKGTIKNPIAASEDFYGKASIVTSGIMVGILAVIYMLSTVFPMLRALIVKNVELATKGHDAGYIAKYLLESYNLSPFHIITSVFYPIIYVALMGGVVIGTAFLVNAVVLKGKVDLRKVFALCGGVILPLIVASAARLLVRAIYLIPAPVTGLAVPFSIVILLCGLLTVLQGLNILNKEIQDRKKLVLTLMITTGTLTLSSWLFEMFLDKCWWFFTLPF